MSDAVIEGADTSGFFATSSTRVLVIGGLLLVAIGMLFGDIFAMFVLHPNNARIGEAMYEAALLIPVGDAESILARFMSIGGFLENRGTKVDTHTHVIHMGYVALLMAILQPYVAFSDRKKLRLAWFYMVSALLLPVSIFSIHYIGLAYSPLEHIGWASILADLFGFFLALAVSVFLIGLWKNFRSGAQISTPVFLQQGDTASRLLLVGGLLLLVTGFLYGAGYAGYHSLGMADSEVDILKTIVASAAAADNDALNQSFAAYGNYQMYRAINIATHTHINEMGILLLLLSLVQAFVYYSERWKRRWAQVLVVSAFGLPLGIILELQVGVVGSILADLFGFTAIVALMAMLFGLLRHTGATDSQQGATT